MPRICSVCRHPDRPAIDKALVSGAALRDVAGRYGLSKSAVERHGNEHLPATMLKAQEATDVRHAIDVVQQLKAINSVCLSVLKDARDMRDGDLALKAVDRIQRQIELQAKLIGQLDERPVVNVLVTSEWMQVRAAIIDALAAHPAARVTVAQTLTRLEAVA